MTLPPSRASELFEAEQRRRRAGWSAVGSASGRIGRGDTVSLPRRRGRPAGAQRPGRRGRGMQACTRPRSRLWTQPGAEDRGDRRTRHRRDSRASGHRAVTFWGGDSFGGLVALEVAALPTAEGERVGQLFLIDAVYGERYWPRSVWLRAVARRTGWHLSEISRMAPTAAARELGLRSRRLAGRLECASRRTPIPPPGHRPPDGPGARGERRVPAPTLRWHDHPHRSVGGQPFRLRRRSGLGGLRRSRRGGAGRRRSPDDDAGGRRAPRGCECDRPPPRRPPPPSPASGRCGASAPPLFTTMRWSSAARLANSLRRAGYRVSACRPRGHPMDAVDGIAETHHLNRLWRQRSLQTAIREARPDIILPDDERALSLLRRLYADIQAEDSDLAELICISSVATGRRSPHALRSRLDARAAGIDAPETARITELGELEAWAAGRAYPVVLKSDGKLGWPRRRNRSRRPRSCRGQGGGSPVHRVCRAHSSERSRQY